MRYHASSVLLVAGLLAIAPSTPAGAQEAERDEPGQRELRIERGDDRLMRIVLNRRARLGIKVNLEARETDSIGAYVDAVTPGGPAAKAEIRSGDVITKVDGSSVLAGGVAAERDDGRKSRPGLRLIELAARLEPNDTVEVEYRREGETRTASLVTEEEPDFLFEAGSGSRPFAMRFFRRGPGDVRIPAADILEGMDAPLAYREFFTGSPLARLELAPVNDELGRYFGTSEGVLVVSAPEDAGLGLEGGDVILAVDGRKPVGPAHLLRILRSYERGESFKLDVLRQRKRETITARLGEREE